MVPFSCAKAKISSQANDYAFPPYRFSLKLLNYFRLNRQKILSSGEGGNPTIRILAQLPVEARFFDIYKPFEAANSADYELV